MANLRSIVAKLNDTMRGTLDGAAGLCVARTHYDVEIEHFLTKLLDASGSDFAGIVQHFGVDKARLAGELARSLDKLKSGNARTPALSPTLVKMLTEAWTLGSIDFAMKLLEEAEVAVSPGRGFGDAGEGYLRLALVENEQRLRQAVRQISRCLRGEKATAV